ncbi:MAG: hypothetical protein R2771_03575 [Saprospiraceae bacterium]
MLPGEKGISWESHLLGAIVGALIAFLLRKTTETHELDYESSYDNNPIEEKYFLDRDTFDLTRNERNRLEP